MNQEQLNGFDNELSQAISQYREGLITIVEFTRFCAFMNQRIGDDTSLTGLVDPQTGMAFPTEAELAAIDAFVDGHSQKL